MSTALAQAHIEAERQLRVRTSNALTAAWRSLPAYNEADVAAWLRMALPIVTASQRASASITNAYLARSLERQPLALDLTTVTGAAARNGTAPAEVYRRPFVTLWSALQNGTSYAAAVDEALARAIGAGSIDVQLAMTRTVAVVSDATPGVERYARVPDPTACDLCQLAAQNTYRSGDLMPIHNHCGCGVELITSGSRFDPGDPPQTDVDVAVHDHGELGPVLAIAGQTFTAL